MRRAVTITAVSAALLGGAAAGFALGTPTIVGAQDDDDATEQVAPEAPTGPAPWVQEALEELVTEGVLTQEQADAVVTRILEKRPERPGPHGHGRGGPHDVPAAAEALGLTGSELNEELRAGKSIAQVAQERGVDVQVVIDARVTAHTERIDEAVAEGRLTEEQAAEKKAALAERVTEMVNTVPPAGGWRRGGPKGPGAERGPDAPPFAEPEAPSPEDGDA